MVEEIGRMGEVLTRFNELTQKTEALRKKLENAPVDSDEYFKLKSHLEAAKRGERNFLEKNRRFKQPSKVL